MPIGEATTSEGELVFGKQVVGEASEVFFSDPMSGRSLLGLPSMIAQFSLILLSSQVAMSRDLPLAAEIDHPVAVAGSPLSS